MTGPSDADEGGASTATRPSTTEDPTSTIETPTVIEPSSTTMDADTMSSPQQAPSGAATLMPKNDVRQMSIPDVMKELPPITPEKETSEDIWGESQMNTGGDADEAATANSTAILSVGLASLSVGPVNPDTFAPNEEQVKVGGSESLGVDQKLDNVQSKGKEQAASPPPPPPPPKDRIYLDPTPMTPLPSAPSSVAGTPPKKSPLRPGFDETTELSQTQSKNETSEDEDAQSEIHSILEQFEPGHEGHSARGPSPQAMSRTNSMNMAGTAHPPRTSSLEALKALPSPPIGRTQSQTSSHSLSRTSTNHSLNEKQPPQAPCDKLLPTPDVPPTPPPRHGKAPTNQPLHNPPPPELNPDLPFDFQRFLEQLRDRTADPVAKYLRSFLSEFSKRQWMVHEQVKIVQDFLQFITGKMAQCEVWREVSDQEFDNAKEGMEKLVMNRLYTQTFSPAIPPPNPPPMGRRSRGRDMQMVGRRGQHQEDVERDDVLAQKVAIYGWVREEHLDIKPVGESGRRFLTLAKQELEKIKIYRAPRDKVICVLNCCKVIFGFIRHSDGDESADRFVPLLIYVVLRANPEHLVSNVQYILRFRNQEKLGGEAGYYLSSLMGAIQFIETLDRSSLTITDAEFEKNVEEAVAAIAEKPRPDPATSGNEERPSRRQAHDGAGERSSRVPLRSVSPRPIQEKEPPPPPSISNNYNHNNNNQNNSNSDPEDSAAAVAGLLRTIQKPLSTIGRIFGEATTPSTVESGSPAGGTPRRQSPVRGPPRTGMNAEEAAARQASAESAEALRIQRAEHENTVAFLSDMFTKLDKDLISDVVAQKEGRVREAVEACLALMDSGESEE